jgi:hypothetical protein
MDCTTKRQSLYDLLTSLPLELVTEILILVMDLWEAALELPEIAAASAYHLNSLPMYYMQCRQHGTAYTSTFGRNPQWKLFGPPY